MATGAGGRWLALLRPGSRRLLSASGSQLTSPPTGRPYQSLRVGVAAETAASERRVALTPAGASTLLKSGFARVNVQAGAGVAAQFSDAQYEAAGATIVQTPADALDADIVLTVRPVDIDRVGMLRPGATLVGHVQPAVNKGLVDALLDRKIDALAMDCIPRTLSRAQAFDSLSSMANIAGYRAVIEAASEFGRFFTGQITAAGRVPPANILVIGGGVAGLSAVGTAKNMGAVVRVFDTRAVVEEQARSLGAEFLKVDMKESGEGTGGYAKEMSEEYLIAQRKLFKDQAREVDIIISTALIPGKKAPLLITREMIDVMKPGSVTVDLAAEAGGNIETTVPGKVWISPNGVKCIGYTDLVSRLPTQSSTLYSNNITKFLLSAGPHTTKRKDHFVIDEEDQAVRGALVTKDGRLMWPAPPLPPPPAPKMKPPPPTPAAIKIDPYEEALDKAKFTTAAIGSALTLGLVSPNPAFSAMLSKLGLASVCGYQTVWGVVPALHSPLMSVTNAISGLTAVGAMVCMGGGLLPDTPSSSLAAAALLASAINIGGYV